jgi:hypothetical protein
MEITTYKREEALSNETPIKNVQTPNRSAFVRCPFHAVSARRSDTGSNGFPVSILTRIERLRDSSTKYCPGLLTAIDLTRRTAFTSPGTAFRNTLPGYIVRPAEARDLRGCNDLCVRVHGHDRGGELRYATEHGTAVVAESDGRIVAYASEIAFFGHAVADTNRDLQALILAPPEFQAPGIPVPTRNVGLFRWCLEQGLRVAQPMTLMTVGLYNEPAGARPQTRKPRVSGGRVPRNCIWRPPPR